MKRIHLIVSGRVQGVGFRWFASQLASACGVTGFAKNLPDGKVEVEAQSEDPLALVKFEEELHKGPRHGNVDSIRKREIPPLTEEGFRTL